MTNRQRAILAALAFIAVVVFAILGFLIANNGKRAFGNIVAIRCIDSEDALTAQPTKLPWEVVTKIQKRITSEIPEIVKVVWDLTPKPPSTIEYI